MTQADTETGTPERIGKWIGDIIAALIMISVVVMMIVQFA
jgi:hypothetical protein